jgi:asparagine synthase (glutamine-hydrolysing)
MCGISVIINKNQNKVSESDIKRMTDIIIHRGPDDEGYFFNEAFAFGFRRLSILDLTVTGHQPMHYPGKYTIIHNGEVYNYLEIRSELIQYGYEFISATDTEVIVAAYDRWGNNCVDHFNGMWAFVIYDKSKNILFCSRDRFGIKPFNYTELKDKFLIGSEIKQFCEIEGFEAVLNTETANEFLVNGQLNSNCNTFFKDVYVLPAGCNLIYDLKKNSYEILKWYSINEIRTVPQITFLEAQHGFYKLFKNSLKLRMRSDVKVGSCLSGGLDSSSIVTMVKELLGEGAELTTVSSCYEQKEYDEQEFIDIVSAKTSFRNVKVFPDLDDMYNKSLLKKIVYHQDQPIPGASHISEYKVFETAAASNLIVMLDGQGADEYLGGYQYLFFHFYTDLLKKLKFHSLFKEIKKSAQLRGGKIIKYWLKYHLQLTFRLFHLFFGSYFQKRPEWIRSTFAFTQPIHIKRIRSFLEENKHLINSSSIPYQLHSEDRNSMANSVESRLPFLDFELVTYMLKIPSGYIIRDGESKAVMRSAIEKLLPSEIRNRHSKLGFAAPEEDWIRNNADRVRKDLEKIIDLSHGFINKNILHLFDAIIKKDKTYDPCIFRVISFGAWLECFDIKMN